MIAGTQTQHLISHGGAILFPMKAAVWQRPTNSSKSWRVWTAQLVISLIFAESCINITFFWSKDEEICPPTSPRDNWHLKITQRKPMQPWIITRVNQTEATPEPVLQSLQMCFRATYQNRTEFRCRISPHLHSFMYDVLILLHPYPFFCS